MTKITSSLIFTAIAILFLHASKVNADTICQVTLCNSIERVTLKSLSKNDKWLGEACYGALIGEKYAVVGKILSTDTRWYQGSFNPAKKSVTRVKSVHGCHKNI